MEHFVGLDVSVREKLEALAVDAQAAEGWRWAVASIN